MRELYSRDRVKGFLHAEGRKMLNGDGDELILRGWGMGNWDNPEGFMIASADSFGLSFQHSPMGRMDRGRALEQIVRETCGTEYLESFWDRWHRAWLGENDIKLLAERGYNSVRLPIRACSFLKEEPGIHWNEETFKMLDDVLLWCEKYKVYAIIDIHAATSGQSCLPCDDGVDNAPHFFIDEESMDRMYILMEEFAKRYKDSWIVGGYDCINEPLSVSPRMFELMPKLREFYSEMIRRFRKFDKNHMMLLNGTQFSSRVDVFDRDYDPECHNWGIAIHAYSMVSPEIGSVSEALGKCKEWNVPLWMGETGTDLEYNWHTTMYELLAEHHVGFNIWSFKLCGRNTGACGKLFFEAPKEWKLIADYAVHGGAKPSFEHAQRIFDEYIENAKFENCRENSVYEPYFMREGSFDIPAIGYNDLPSDSRKSKALLPSPIEYRRSDCFGIIYEKGFNVPVSMPGAPSEGHLRDHMQLCLSAGEYASYSVHEPGEYTVAVSYCAEKPFKLCLSTEDGIAFEGAVPAAAEKLPEPGARHPVFPNEAAANTLTEFSLGKLKGEHCLRLEVTEGSACFGKIIIRKL